jgi:hypothetical protein
MLYEDYIELSQHQHLSEIQNNKTVAVFVFQDMKPIVKLK